MAGVEPIDWMARLDRELEPLRRLAPHFRRLIRGVEQFSKQVTAARERGDFLNLRMNLWLMFWMGHQLNAAKRNPAHPTAQAWLRMRNLSVEEIAKVLPYMILVMHDVRVPQCEGRPDRISASTLEMAKELAKRINDTGEPPTTAARSLLTEAGFRGNLKGRADSLVRAWKKRALNSR